MINLIKKIICIFNCLPDWIYVTLGRVIIALVFWRSGLTKIDENWNIKSSTFFLFEKKYQVPVIPSDLAAYMATAAELTLPILLIIGLATRFAALGLLIMTAVIQTFVFPGAYITHGLWATVLLAILIKGAGPISLDWFIAKKFDENK